MAGEATTESTTPTTNGSGTPATKSALSSAALSPAVLSTAAPALPQAPDPRYQLAPAPPLPLDAGIPKPTAQGNAGHARLPRLLIGVLLLLIIGSGVWWWSRSGQPLPWAQPAGPLTASGTLETDEVIVSSEIAGRIVDLVQEGQTVNAGDLVAQLDDSLIQVQIAQAALAARQQLEVQHEKYQLRSPISGVVTRVPMHKGEVVSPATTVAAVADLSSLELMAYVLENDLGQVRVGQPVAVSADPFPGRSFAGVVVSTNPRAEFTPRNVQTQADRRNLVFGVKVRVENPDLALKPGMPADVTFLPAP